MYFHHADPAHPAAQYDTVCDPDAPEQPDPTCPGCDAKAEHIRFEYRWAGTHIDHWRCTDPECGDEFKTFNQ
jgi:hypothetical protein